MYIMTAIIHDTKEALQKAFPDFEIDVQLYKERLFITVLDEQGEDVPNEQILTVLEKAYTEAKTTKVNDTQWRALSEAVYAVKNADALQKWRKDWEAVEANQKKVETQMAQERIERSRR